MSLLIRTLYAALEDQLSDRLHAHRLKIKHDDDTIIHICHQLFPAEWIAYLEITNDSVIFIYTNSDWSKSSANWPESSTNQFSLYDQNLIVKLIATFIDIIDTYVVLYAHWLEHRV